MRGAVIFDYWTQYRRSISTHDIGGTGAAQDTSRDARSTGLEEPCSDDSFRTKPATIADSTTHDPEYLDRTILRLGFMATTSLLSARLSAVIQAAALAAMATLVSCRDSASAVRPLSDDDRRAIRANDSTYVSAWMRDDTSGVLSTLTADAVLVPGGMQPVRGLAGARAFWFPQDGSHTKLSTFNRSIDEIDGTGDVAYIRGSDSLRFTYSKDGATQDQSLRSITLAIVRRQRDGSWRISRMMWATVTH